MEIEFDTSLYPQSAIKKAIKDYKNLADFACKRSKDKFLIRISNIKDSSMKPLFAGEFSNYVLALSAALK